LEFFANPRLSAGDAEFADYAAKLTEVFTGWRTAHLERLKDLNIGDHPKQLIEAISEDLLVRFAKVALIDKYEFISFS
jgi:type I restriction enzyme M protein